MSTSHTHGYFQLPDVMRAADGSIISYTKADGVQMTAYSNGLWWVVPSEEKQPSVETGYRAGAFVEKVIIGVDPRLAADPKNWL